MGRWLARLVQSVRALVLTAVVLVTVTLAAAVSVVSLVPDEQVLPSLARVPNSPAWRTSPRPGGCSLSGWWATGQSKSPAIS
jgi:hypothetical protein